MADLQFYFFLTLFQSYQDDGRVIMKAVCNGTSFTIEKIPATTGARTWNR